MTESCVKCKAPSSLCHLRGPRGSCFSPMPCSWKSTFAEEASASVPVPIAGGTRQTTNDSNYVQTILSLNILMRALERKLKDIKDFAPRTEHSYALAHIRTALSYEQRVQSELTDPNGMCSLTNEALGQLLSRSPSQAALFLEETTPVSEGGDRQ